MIILILVLISCKQKDFNIAIEIIDNNKASEWLTDGMDSSIFIGYEIIPYTIILEKYLDEYVNKLENEQFFILSSDDYYLMTGKILEKKYGLAIRAVYSQMGMSFSVIRYDNNEYDVLYIGAQNEFNKTVLLIEADELPAKIYIGLAGPG